MKKVETPLVQQDMGSHRARMKLAWWALYETCGQVACSKDGKAVLSEVAHCKDGEAVLIEIAHSKYGETILGETTHGKDGEATCYEDGEIA